MNTNVENIITRIKKKLDIREEFTKASAGTNSQVFLSKRYVIKMNKDVKIIENEYLIIKSLKSNFVPEILQFLTLDNYGIIVEKRLNGKTIDKVWKNIDDKNRSKIILDLIEAINYFHNKQKDYFWQLRSNKEFKTYSGLLLDRFEKYKKKIFNNQKAYNLFLKIGKYLEKDKVERVFKNVKSVLVHGDLIMHNILTDTKRLTGIVDWEYAQFGDPFYDLARVAYYQECAKAYVDEQKDECFEYDFTTSLIAELKKVIRFNEEKYKIIRSVYFIDSIIWALESNNPEKNLSELEVPVFDKPTTNQFKSGQCHSL